MAPVLAWSEHGGNETSPGVAPLLWHATRTLLRLGRTASTTGAGTPLYGPNEEYAHLHPPAGAVVAEEAHRALSGESEEEEHPLFWLFNTTVLLLALGAVGTTCYYVNRHGCLGIYGTWHDRAPGLRESDLAFARIVLERQLAKEALTKDPPEVREKKLRKWLVHQDCHMVGVASSVAPRHDLLHYFLRQYVLLYSTTRHEPLITRNAFIFHSRLSKRLIFVNLEEEETIGLWRR
jgi:hypothetical protein